MQRERRSEPPRYDVISWARVASWTTFRGIYSRNRGYCLTEGGRDAPPVEVEEEDEEQEEERRGRKRRRRRRKKTGATSNELRSASVRRTRFSRGKYSPFSVTSPEGSCNPLPSRPLRNLSLSLFLPTSTCLPACLLSTPPCLCRQSHLTSLRRKNVGTDPIFPLASQRIVLDLISSLFVLSCSPAARSIPAYPIINTRLLVKSTFHSRRRRRNLSVWILRDAGIFVDSLLSANTLAFRWWKVQLRNESLAECGCDDSDSKRPTCVTCVLISILNFWFRAR